MDNVRYNKKINKLSKLYKMPKSYVRHMLAVEEGISCGDVKECGGNCTICERDKFS